MAIQGTSMRTVAGGRSTAKAVPCATADDVRARPPTSPSPAIPSAPESVVCFHSAHNISRAKSIITGARDHVTPLRLKILLLTDFIHTSAFFHHFEAINSFVEYIVSNWSRSLVS